MNPLATDGREPDTGHEPRSRTDGIPAGHNPAASGDAAAERRNWLSILARATRAELEDALSRIFGNTDRASWPAYDWLRVPETGLAMVRGRMGGTGDPFNTGETTVTRAVLRLKGVSDTPPVGLSYQLGRDKRRAELAALADALLQLPAHAPAVRVHLLVPVTRRLGAERDSRRADVASTRVEFFTMVRGE